ARRAVGPRARRHDAPARGSELRPDRAGAFCHPLDGGVPPVARVREDGHEVAPRARGGAARPLSAAWRRAADSRADLDPAAGVLAHRAFESEQAELGPYPVDREAGERRDALGRARAAWSEGVEQADAGAGGVRGRAGRTVVRLLDGLGVLVGRSPLAG